MKLDYAAIWHGLRSLGAVILVLSAVVVSWVAVGLPTMAWSTDIKRLDISQVKLSIEFNRDKSLNLFQRAFIVRERIIVIEAPPDVDWEVDHVQLLKEKAGELEREVKLIDQKVIELEKYALELERK